jgi:hypothetical protein
VVLVAVGERIGAEGNLEAAAARIAQALARSA